MRMLCPRGVCLSVVGVLTLVSVSFSFASSPHLARALSMPPAVADRTQLPDTLLPRVNASLAADDPAYAVTMVSDDRTTLRAVNAAHHLMTTFAPDGIAFTGERGARWSLRLAAVGADAVSPTLAPIIAGTRVEYRRGDLTEWYLNGPLGVEQGFTLAAPPRMGDALALTLAVRGGTTPQIDGSDVALTMPDGEVFQYGHLRVTDATGRQLPAHMSINHGAIAITTNLTGAAYPVTVDPLVQQKILTASDGADGDYFGFSVATSSDGTRVIVGAFNTQIGASQAQGEAYVYSGTNYGTEKKLAASDGAAFDYFGQSVAMSADGTKVIVGASGKYGMNPHGAAYIYSGTNYGTEKKVLASDGAFGDSFGRTVAMSSDGTRVIVGAFNTQIGASQAQGEAYVYSGTNYGTEKKLAASDGAERDEFGYAVAISGDGTRVIVGAIAAAVGGNPEQGAVYVYSGANYATEKRLSDSDGLIGDSFGTSVAMSSDGTRVIVGANLKIVGMNDSQGAAYVYSGVNYATEKKLLASDGAANDYFGSSVAMSGDGTKVIVGAFLKQVGANTQQGEGYVYSGANYATEQRLTASDGAANDNFGFSVTMSGDGTRVAVGAPYKQIGANASQGSAYVYAASSLPNPLPPVQSAGPPQVGTPAPLPPIAAPVGPPQAGKPAPLPQARP
jgi:trimeric autotransporter adhesin